VPKLPPAKAIRLGHLSPRLRAELAADNLDCA
jgi:hypothetical protein